MKTLIVTLLAIAISANSFCQTYVAQFKPSGAKLWGYIDENNKVVIEPKYAKCYAFSQEGLAPIYQDKKYQFIKTNGEVIETEIEKFKLIESFGFGLQGFSDGMVAVKEGKTWGYLNTEGKLAVATKYDAVTPFSNGHAIVKKGTFFFVLNKAGEEVLVEVSNLKAIKKFSEGLAPFDNNDKMSGFINEKGEEVIPAKFMSVGYFNGGAAWAKTMDKKVGFIDKKGNWLVEPQFVKAKNVDPISGLARVNLGESWAFTNMKGELLKVPDAEKVSDFQDGLAWARKGGLIGFINPKGEWLIKPQFDAVRDFKNGFAAVRKGDKWGFINTKGELVIDTLYDGVKDMAQVK